MKRFFSLLCILVICTLTAVVPAAAADMPRLVDDGDLLAQSAEDSILAKLDEISERQQFDVVIVTVDSLGGKNIRDYADDFYDYNGYGFGEDYDGVLLLVAVNERECWMSTCGYGEYAFNDGDIDYILDRFAEQYGYENYAKAFDTFADDCEYYITLARESEEFDPVFTLLIALVVGFVIAFIATAIMKGKLKSVRSRARAEDYVRRNSLIVTESRDFFLYRTVSRREKPKNNSGGSTHTSSSGRSHGGGGRSL